MKDRVKINGVKNKIHYTIINEKFPSLSKISI